MASLQEEIDRSFGDDPPHRPVEERLMAGRRAVRRRRAAQTVAAGLAVVGLFSGVWTVSGPGSQQRGDERFGGREPYVEPRAKRGTDASVAGR